MDDVQNVGHVPKVGNINCSQYLFILLFRFANLAVVLVDLMT